MSHIAFVSGASGLVGVQLLHQLFKNESVDWVVSFGRRELAFKHQKLVQLKVDFEQLDKLNLEDEIRKQNMGGDKQPLLKALSEASTSIMAFSALGTTIKKAGSKENFYRIDHDYVLDFARMTIRLGAKRFLYVSAIGADAQSNIHYNSVKGKVEDGLKRMDFNYVGLFQPSILLGERNENRPGEEIGKAVMKFVTFFGLFSKYKPIYDHQVAKAMVQKALNLKMTGNETISSSEMHKMTK
ncbi:NAD-dependent epimerase/dehydratase family protein [uncultured Cyclobacterium sp.]|uniref:NAD-dependent epimerase/dehydratase family protein n=1 Tax=uncultured Cyclobacterium sp. TaxID=453820 RepID=UPI0030EE2A5C|tara:strand:+ start:188118 stop:188840 length:723 start_codon:yes stop_codon:yes gene_type:complete